MSTTPGSRTRYRNKRAEARHAAGIRKQALAPRAIPALGKPGKKK